MKICFYKIAVTSICMGLFVFLNTQQVQCQQKMKYVTACIIFDNLVFGSRFNKSVGEINTWLIEQIQKRKVDFSLRPEEEKSLKRIGASDSLIKAIRENFSKELQEKTNLYKKFTDNYNGKTTEQKKIALDAAKEFIEKYADDEESKDIIEYLKKFIPYMEKKISSEIQK